MNRIVVCGLGKLGSPIASVFASAGVSVVGYDLDSIKVNLINDRIAPVVETGLQEAITKTPFGATTDPAEAVRDSTACCFITPTPSLPDGSFSNEFLIQSLTTIAREVRNLAIEHYLFIVNSTVTPGTCDSVILPLLKQELGDLDFHLVYKPEFIALGTVCNDLMRPGFVLFGASSEEAGFRARQLYDAIYCKTSELPNVMSMSLIEVEIAKIANNCFRTMKVSFANQVGVVSSRLGANPQTVLDSIGIDPRIGKAWLHFGLPFGGPCWPRDNKLFQHVAEKAGVDASLAKATDSINLSMIWWIVQQARDHSETDEIGILGQSYKAFTGFTEESPGVKIRDILVSVGRKVKTHDPQAEHSHSLEEVLACPTVIVATAWPEYASVQYKEGMFLIDPMKVIRALRLT